MISFSSSNCILDCGVSLFPISQAGQLTLLGCVQSGLVRNKDPLHLELPFFISKPSSRGCKLFKDRSCCMDFSPASVPREEQGREGERKRRKEETGARDIYLVLHKVVLMKYT